MRLPLYPIGVEHRGMGPDTGGCTPNMLTNTCVTFALRDAVRVSTQQPAVCKEGCSQAHRSAGQHIPFHT